MRLVVQVEIYLDPIWVTNNYAVHVFFVIFLLQKPGHIGISTHRHPKFPLDFENRKTPM